MKKNTLLTVILVASGLPLLSCGDNKKALDAALPRDAPVDAANVFPTPPTLGAEIDRMGRPAINTALNHAFDPTAAAGSAKDAYNQDGGGPAAWTSNGAYLSSFVQSLAILDALDQGLNGASAVGAACGNQVLYDATTATAGPHACFTTPGNPATFTGTSCSYAASALFASDDELYVETSKSTCNLYLAVELDTEVLRLGAVAQTCGGRAPSYDVIDYSYSALAAFPSGFTTVGGALVPQIGDNVGMHSDTSDTTFPFLGTPHP
jgi:hypothetical protein